MAAACRWVVALLALLMLVGVPEAASGWRVADGARAQAGAPQLTTPDGGDAIPGRVSGWGQATAEGEGEAGGERVDAPDDQLFVVIELPPSQSVLTPRTTYQASVQGVAVGGWRLLPPGRGPPRA
jgi:hypothetical protein